MVSDDSVSVTADGSIFSFTSILQFFLFVIGTSNTGQLDAAINYKIRSGCHLIVNFL